MKVVVIGAGPAGMMAAIHSAASGAEVSLYEKNEKTGKKLFITGKGRCNLTNASDIETVFANINRNPKFLFSAIYSFDNSAVMEMFEHENLRLKTERGNRVFPASDHSSDVIKALDGMLKKNGVAVNLNTEVSGLIIKEGVCKGIKLKNGREVFADKVIVATGGISYPSTGSTGDGYRFAVSAGHTVVKPEPSLIGLVCNEEWVRSLQGLSLKNVELKLYKGKKVVYEELGEMLFTHFGISGPLVLSASALINERDVENGDIYVSLDLKPGLDKEALDKRLLRDFEKNINKNFGNSLNELLPSKMIDVIINKSGIAAETKVNAVTRVERQGLCDLLKDLRIEVNGFGPIEEAIVTRGGISVKEINPSTMESKLCKNLYFAGEVIDVDAMTGGYNLQIAWSTGYLAGEID